jgi:4-hydroxy-2-oxoheptanedioate aldolase
MVEFSGWLGFDYVFIDAEHGPIGYPECKAMVRACEARGMSSIVRVPKLDHSLIAKYLETGVLGVAVPHINTAEQAEVAVESARYAPDGRRGCDAGASRSSAYGLIEPACEYFVHSKQETLVAVWVEEVEGMRNLDKVLQVPGVDLVDSGSGDLALSMGLPGLSDHPDVQAAVAEGRRKVVAGGKALIAEPGDATSAEEALALGALLLTTDVQELWANAARSYLDKVRG